MESHDRVVAQGLTQVGQLILIDLGVVVAPPFVTGNHQGSVAVGSGSDFDTLFRCLNRRTTTRNVSQNARLFTFNRTLRSVGIKTTNR